MQVGVDESRQDGFTCQRLHARLRRNFDGQGRPHRLNAVVPDNHHRIRQRFTAVTIDQSCTHQCRIL